MVVIGIDAHKRTHTAVLIDINGRQLASRTCGSPAKITWHCCAGQPVKIRNGLGRSRTAGT